MDNLGESQLNVASYVFEGENKKYAEEYGFGVNLVNFLFRCEPTHPIMFVEWHTRIPCPGFNEKSKGAALAIENWIKQYADDHFVALQHKGVINVPTYAEYISDLQKLYFSEGFDAEKFLFYSVHVASMASRFYECGEPLIPMTAANTIYKALDDYGMFSGGWGDLDQAAEKILSSSDEGENLPSFVTEVYSSG